MTRSIWKGPFVDGYLLKKADAARGIGPLATSSRFGRRRSTILPQFVGLTFGVYNGHKHIPVLVSGGDDRPQVRRIRADPHVSRPFRRQEGQEGLIADVQAVQPRRQAENEAKATTRMLRVSPQKLNLVAQLIREPSCPG